MSLAPGTKLSHFEIRERIGAGGMGEVYRATDTTLRRDVAIKLLPDAFARDAERVARFKREAQLLAALNHPNIATIHGLFSDQSSGGQQYFLVMELVGGETLAEAIRQCRDRQGAGVGFSKLSGKDQKQPPLADARGTVTGLPIDEALSITTQICEALEHAHERGVIHRDLKPANVKVTPEGKVKVLDFGLAKAFAADGAAAGEASPNHGVTFNSQSPTLSGSPTLTASPTIPGVILGTAAYMSPEQARGKPVDKRTDIWALGCVLYEMLTGKQAFSGEDVTEILAAVVKSEPDWTALPAATPPAIRALLRRCLKKEAKSRYHDAADIRITFEDMATAASATPTVTAAPRRWLLYSAAACVLVAVLAGIAAWTLRPMPAKPVTRTIVAMPADERLVTPAIVPLALSPDGSTMVYVAQKGSDSLRLYLRTMNSLEDRPLAGTENADMPFFAPDGQWVGFFSQTALKKVPITGGAVLTICATGTGLRGASWGPDNKIAYGTNATNGLFQVSAAGGTPETLTSLDASKAETNHRWPEILPGGKAVLFVAYSSGSFDDATIVVQRLDTGERKVLLQGGTFPHYAPTGHLVYYRAGTLLSLPFDLDRLEVRGSPAPVIEGVRSAGAANAGGANFAISSTGALAYVPGSPQGDVSTLVWVDRQGGATPLKTAARSFGGTSGPRLSPDGQSVAVQINEQKAIFGFTASPGKP